MDPITFLILIALAIAGTVFGVGFGLISLANALHDDPEAVRDRRGPRPS